MRFWTCFTVGLHCNCSQHWRPLFWLENVVLWDPVASASVRSTGHFASVGTLLHGAQSTQGHNAVTFSALLAFLPQGQRDSLFSQLRRIWPLLSWPHLILEESTPHPPVLLPLKALCKVSSIHSGFYKTGRALVLEQLLLSTLVLQVSFVSSLLF